MNRLLPVLILVASACASPSRSARFGDRVRLHDATPCRPHVYGNDLPARFLVVGRVEAESPTDRSRLVGVLSRDACAMGADALMELQIGTYDTVKSRFDEKTRESSIEQGPQLHAATALAIKVLDATLVKSTPTQMEPLCAPCPACERIAAPASKIVTPRNAQAAPARDVEKGSGGEDDLPPPPPPVFDDR